MFSSPFDLGGVSEQIPFYWGKWKRSVVSVCETLSNLTQTWPPHFFPGQSGESVAFGGKSSSWKNSHTSVVDIQRHFLLRVPNQLFTCCVASYLCVIGCGQRCKSGRQQPRAARTLSASRCLESTNSKSSFVSIQGPVWLKPFVRGRSHLKPKPVTVRVNTKGIAQSLGTERENSEKDFWEKWGSLFVRWLAAAAVLRAAEEVEC